MPPQDTSDWTVEFYSDRRGRTPAREFLRSLNEHERAEALRLIRLLREQGIELGMPYARPIGACGNCGPVLTASSMWPSKAVASSFCTPIASGARLRQRLKLKLRSAVGPI